MDNAISAADPKANDGGMRVLRNKEIANAIRKVVPLASMLAAINMFWEAYSLSDAGAPTNEDGVIE